MKAERDSEQQKTLSTFWEDLLWDVLTVLAFLMVAAATVMIGSF